MFSNITEMRNVAIYIRVSTEDQAKEGFSLPAQLKKLRAYCVSQDWKIQREYIDDGYTGKNMRRPKYKEMFENINLWDGILVMKMDRIHRNHKNFLDMMDQLMKQGKEFISSMESFNTNTAMGRFVAGILQGVAELESGQNAERVTMAMVQKAQDMQAGWVGHRLAFGYKLKDGEIMPIPEQLEIIKQVYLLYSEGNTMYKIEKHFGYKNVNGKQKPKVPWSQIRYWLNNIWYVGYEQWGNCFKLIDIEPVISPDLWNIVQSRKRKAPGGPTLKPFILNEKTESFVLTDKEMREHGFSMDIIKNQGV